MKHIVLIETKSPHLHVYSSVHIPRLGSVLLGSILQELGYKVDVYIEDVAPVDFDHVKKADLVGISTLTSTAPRSYKIAEELRSHGIPVIIGGTHATFETEEVLNHADFVIRSEADESFPEFVKTYFDKGDLSQVRGLSYWEDGKQKHNPDSPLPTDLDKNPIPDFGLVRGIPHMQIMTVSTSRGCPFDCSFCSVTTFNGKQWRTLSVDHVLREIDFNLRKFNSRLLFFADDIFNWNRKRTKELLRGMIDNHLTPAWGAQVRHEASRDPELMELMRQANCQRLYVGFESINQRTLEAFNKHETRQNVVETIERFHQHKLKIHGMFVVGSDEDDVETIRDTVKFCKKYRVDTAQFMVLTPLPGARDFAAYKNGTRKVLTDDWSYYDGHHVVHTPARMTPYELQVESINAMRDFYSLGEAFRLFVRGDFYEAGLRLCGYKIVKQWFKDHKDYVQNLRDDLLPKENNWLPASIKSLWGKRVAIASSESNSAVQPVLETFFKELGVNVVSLSDRITSAVSRGQQYISNTEINPKEYLQNLRDKAKEETDVIFLILRQELKTVSGKVGQGYGDLSKSIRGSVQSLPKIIHLPPIPMESVRNTLTGLGLLFTDDLLRISQARDKALAMV